MEFKLGDKVFHTVDVHLTYGVVIQVLENDTYKVAWVGPGFVSVLHAEFIDKE